MHLNCFMYNFSLLDIEQIFNQTFDLFLIQKIGYLVRVFRQKGFECCYTSVILNYIYFIGSYFCYDNPGALQDTFMKDLNLTTTSFVALYSIYSWPNVILCFIGGFLIDRYLPNLVN